MTSTPLPTRPGAYWFTDQPGNHQRIEIQDDDGDLCARFVDEIEGDALIPLKDLAGTFEGPLAP